MQLLPSRTIPAGQRKPYVQRLDASKHQLIIRDAGCPRCQQSYSPWNTEAGLASASKTSLRPRDPLAASSATPTASQSANPPAEAHLHLGDLLPARHCFQVPLPERPPGTILSLVGPGSASHGAPIHSAPRPWQPHLANTRTSTSAEQSGRVFILSPGVTGFGRDSAPGACSGIRKDGMRGAVVAPG